MSGVCEYTDRDRGARAPDREQGTSWIARRLGDAAIVAGALALAFILIAVGE
ncbi:MAG TPA: hypothetical protein VGN94_03740 [Methylobacterium sp.]|nr:hypothetical protein [Methylobacterium sp.]